MMRKPLECPFCHEIKSYYEVDGWNKGYVVCHSCGATGPKVQATRGANVKAKSLWMKAVERQAIAATLGNGECKCVWNEQEGEFRCSSCDTLLTDGFSIDWPSHKVVPITLPNFCPNCGKAVKR